MDAIFEVLRYLLARVPHSTQEDHDQIAALIDAAEAARAARAAEQVTKENPA